jgi:hypothetical protein
MTEPTDPTELLARANPVATYDIDPARLDSMITRVTATPLKSRFSLLRTWQMRAGSAVAAGAVVVTAVVVSLGGAPQGLSVLALNGATPVAGPTSHSALSASGLTFSTAIKAAVPSSVTSPAKLVAGPALSTKTGSAPVFRFEPATKTSGALKDLAIDLGVLDPTSRPSCPWGVTGTNASVTAYPIPTGVCAATSAATSLPITWSFSMKNSACPPPLSGESTVVVPCPTVQNGAGSGAPTRKLLAWSSSLVKKLEAHGLLVSGLTPGTPNVERRTNSVDYPLEANGVTLANEFEEFQFTSYGLLIDASGLLGHVSLVSDYPVISPAAGIPVLKAAPSLTSTGINPGGPMIPAPSTSSTPTPTPAPTQTVQSATLNYEIAQLKDGAVVLVPQYVYVTHGGTTLQVLALSPKYFTVPKVK